ncbi:hypothetical protein L2E82_21278 [Cichorium intybus]|uniref:Uncharacterized protein n=1 Tax=Cichorium intybus TaxID=13427 RepID=A0ACB9DWI1_CICIN|nr:hypothetical protein L2E82_21278 [Cichorium intybus]
MALNIAVKFHLLPLSTLLLPLLDPILPTSDTDPNSWYCCEHLNKQPSLPAEADASTESTVARNRVDEVKVRPLHGWRKGHHQTPSRRNYR